MKPRHCKGKDFKGVCFSLFVIVAILLLSGLATAQNLKIYCIDVNQGSSTLIITPEGKSILIDCGDDNMADSVYKVITEQAGLNSVDYFVCTHYHGDHYGALDKLTEKGFTATEKYYDRNSQNWLGEHRTNSTDYKEYADIAGDKREYLRPGRKIPADDDVNIECIVANGRAKDEYGPINYPSDENGYSIGLIVSYKGFDFLIAGDLTDEVEPKLVQQGILKDVDVYHASHHGSETSSCAAFLNTIKPEVCIISSGSHGGHKHPRKNTIERLQDISTIQYIFQLNKNVKENLYPDEVRNVSDECIGDLDCDGYEGTILIEVNDSTYKVKILNTGLEKIFNIQT